MLDLYTRAMKASAHQGKLRNQEDKLDWFYVIQKECAPDVTVTTTVRLT